MNTLFLILTPSTHSSTSVVAIDVISSLFAIISLFTIADCRLLVLLMSLLLLCCWMLFLRAIVATLWNHTLIIEVVVPVLPKKSWPVQVFLLFPVPSLSHVAWWCHGLVNDRLVEWLAVDSDAHNLHWFLVVSVHDTTTNTCHPLANPV